ncbi:hypothetical protein SAMN05421780_108183 [Flexibacter flexilis DSM 6793]|uniref:Uncharacterized protein n=1 Tax=Flexibacter flexilis DSM 6793 TaxID=927664 RepID=A0A1I1LDM2_9BACT|nr:hypothetical protein [Flexibacter flexilis]SFC71101.1 hypothetical protein SAMN05421780_108183 [Flexibacter flexilis DSM 6793]
MTQPSEGSKIFQLPALPRELKGTDLLPLSDESGNEPTYKVTLGQLKAFVAANVNAEPPISIPQLTLLCDNNNIYLRWSAFNQKFLEYQPIVCLLRGKPRQKSKKRNGADLSVKFKISARWTHPKHNDSANVGRATEFALPAENSLLAVPIEREQWFRTMPVDEEGHYRLIPRGTKSSSGRDIRKNQYFAFAIQITVDGKKYYGAFSRVVKIGYNRIQAIGGLTDKVLAAGAMTDNYIPVIQLL